MGPKKRKKLSLSESPLQCVLHFPECHETRTLKIDEIKYGKIKELAEKRQALPLGSVARFDDICQQFPKTFTADIGHHRYCYKKFARNKERLESESKQQDVETKIRSSRKKNQHPENIKFNLSCIFCNKTSKKKVLKNHKKTTERLIPFKNDNWQQIVTRAELLGEERLLLRIRGYDLKACGAHYHTTCKKAFMRKNSALFKSKNETSSIQKRLEETHDAAFNVVCKMIDEEIIIKKNVIKLSDLRVIYCAALENTEFENTQYRGEKLKEKLIKVKKYEGKLDFVKLDRTSKYPSHLVYSKETDVATLVKNVYTEGSRESYKNVASNLRQSIVNSHESSTTTGWPPSLESMKTMDSIPDDLSEFLALLLMGKCKDLSEKNKRYLLSIGQDICRAVSNGVWKFPKHILLCMTIRHLFRSKELTTLFNRLGHCESYSFALELETAIATAFQKSSSILCEQIYRKPIGPSVFHSEFDNFDQFVNDLSGSGSVHTAHGIMLQDCSFEQPAVSPENTTLPKTKQRSWKDINSQTTQACYMSQRKSPVMKVERTSFPGSLNAFTVSVQKDLTWIVLRMIFESQNIPAWAGFLSTSGKVPDRLTAIGYYPAIFKPITQYETVQECLQLAEKATDEVGQYYVYSTFDLGVCMKAYPILWNFPEQYDRHIVLIGTFHLIMGYFNMIGKKMESTGFSDILIESNLISSGSLHGVLSGKSYSRATRCHKVLYEALHRLLLTVFTSTEEGKHHLDELHERKVDILDDFLKTPSKESQQSLMDDDLVKSFVENYSAFCDSVRAGSIGKTGQFWISYMDHISLVLLLMRSVKLNDFELYTYCMSAMPDLFFSFGGHNYAKYLTYFSVHVVNLDYTHPGAVDEMKLGVISVARSFIPGNRCAVDKTMEETFMRHAKSRGGSGVGIAGITQNPAAYQRWVATTHQRSQYLNATYALVDMHGDQHGQKQHRDLRQADRDKGELLVKAAMEATENFLNPFTIADKNGLYNISSGCKVPLEIEKDILDAEQLGKQEKEKFIDERLRTDQKFFEPVKKLKLKTMGMLNKKMKSSSGVKKVVEYKQQSNLALQLLVKSQAVGKKLDLAEVMTFQLTPVPFCLGTSDGFLNKTNKAAGFTFIAKDLECEGTPDPSKTINIVDGNALFHSITELPDTFGGVCAKIFAALPRASDLIFSTDSYDVKSVKSMERNRRGVGERLLIKGPKMKRPGDWKGFLTNDANKEMLTDVLLSVWSDDSFAGEMLGRKVSVISFSIVYLFMQVILIVRGTAYELTSEDGQKMKRREVLELRTNHEESDTKIILCALFGCKKGYDFIKIRSPDSDVFFVLLHHAHKIKANILFDTGNGNKRRLLNIKTLADNFGPNKCEALLALHSFTGCDSTSSFKGIAKIKPIKVFLKDKKYEKTFASLGVQWKTEESTLREIEDFTCSMYGNSKVKSVNSLRYSILKKKCDERDQLDIHKHVDLNTLPPCWDSLYQHIKRTVYQTGIWKRANENFMELPPAEENGWTSENASEYLEPLWCEEPVLPDDLFDLLENDSDSDEETLPDKAHSSESSDDDDF